MTDILYIHGMGGGEDSRIPAILNDWFKAHQPDVRVIIRTYDFNPDIAALQISSWYDECRPTLVIGESMGANLALELLANRAANGDPFPLLLVSPALGVPKAFTALAVLVGIPGLTRWLERHFLPRPGKRQVLHFTAENLKAWKRHQFKRNAGPVLHAFFGTRDRYRRFGIVSVLRWRLAFGGSRHTMYEGTHFMEEEHILDMLIPAIRKIIRP